jgi:uncharacterized protein
MKNRVSEFSVGLLFGMGLIISGMTNPEKVLGFLDLFGEWEPSLIFVMAGGILIGFFAFSIAQKRTHSLIGERISLPIKNPIDPPLVIGAMIFGVGWGLVGLCPGPAIVSFGEGQIKSLVFVIFMLMGMWAFQKIKGS